MEKFLKDTYLTSKGSTLTVIGDTGKVVGSKRIFKINCNVCSIDTELYPKLESSISNLRKGAVPCGCTNIPKWSHEQYKVLISRLTKELNYDWDFEDTKLKGSSRLNLTCNVHNYSWNTTTVSGFTKTGVRCKICTQNLLNIEKLNKFEDELKVSGILQNDDKLFLNNKKVDSKNQKSFIDLQCNSCSQDEYTDNKLCTGIFPTQRYSLRKGHKPCRCSKSFKWTSAQREYQARSVCNSNGGSFVSWKEEYKNSYSELLCSCTNGHIFTKTVNELINNNSWCRICVWQESSHYGFYPDRCEDTDYLYLIDFTEPCKIGRSFYPKLRLTQLGSSSNLQCNTINIYKGRHEDVYNLEQTILKFINKSGFRFYCDWTTEAFLSSYKIPVKDYITKNLKDYNLVEVTFEE